MVPVAPLNVKITWIMFYHLHSTYVLTMKHKAARGLIDSVGMIPAIIHLSDSSSEVSLMTPYLHCLLANVPLNHCSAEIEMYKNLLKTERI